jgi:cell division protein FtsL
MINTESIPLSNRIIPSTSTFDKISKGFQFVTNIFIIIYVIAFLILVYSVKKLIMDMTTTINNDMTILNTNLASISSAVKELVSKLPK